MHELHLSSFFSSIFISSSIFSSHSSTNLSINLFLHLHLSQSKYSSISNDLLHSKSELLGFQVYPLLHAPLSVNYLHLHLYLSLFQYCSVLQTTASNVHSHLHVSCHFMCLISLVLNIRLNTLDWILWHLNLLQYQKDIFSHMGR